MVKIRRAQINRFLGLASLMALAVIVVLLVGVERQYRGEMENQIHATAAAFEQADLLRSPGDRVLNFRAIEDLARQSREGSGVIRQIFVVKHLGYGTSGRDILLYPWHYGPLHLDWETRLAALRQVPIHVSHTRVGTLYFDLNTRTLRGMRMALLATAVLIGMILATLALQLHRQQRSLAEAERILAQNREEMIRLERLSLAGQLSANIFHDMRKPVTNIKHEMEDLAEALGGFAGATRALRNMREHVALFFDILNDLNFERFVRSDRAAEEYVDVNRVLEQSLRLVHYERGAVRPLLDFSDDLPLTLAHPYRLVQVFSNVILNAYQAMDGKGELTVRTRPGGDPRQKSREARQGIVVEIMDTGPGILSSRQEHIFAPFYTTKSEDKGTGLGLYITRMILLEVGGYIWLESVPGGGSVFRIFLPGGE